MILILLTILAATAVYLFLKSNYEYWKKRGVPGPKPSFLLGNVGQSFFMKKSLPMIYTDIYRKYPNLPIVGIYRGCTPALLIRDPEVIKDMTIKSFDHFHDNDFELDKKADPIFGRNPFSLKGEEWKTVRGQLTPGFTSGKMKWIYPHLEEVSLQMVKFIEEKPTTTNGEGYEAKELCSRFTLNNVACCAFGLDGKCFEEENSEFSQLGKKFLTPGGWALTVFFLITLMPSMAKIFPIRLVPKDVEKKLIEIVSETVKYREENKIIRNDFLHILGQLKKTCTDYKFTDVDVTAHAGGFFADGYESSSIVMSFTLYNLASNPKVQAELREEICKTFQENDNKLPYEALQEMSYLDGVINESLRLHPVISSLQKLCTKPYTFLPKDFDQIGKPVLIENGTPVIFPVYGLHTDPKYFKEPESFKPERFIGTNKEKITKGTFLPFGEGPRACLGQRFGLLQVKIGIVYVVKNYLLSVNKKTRVPIELDPRNVLTSPIGGLWIDFKKIV